MRSSSFIILSLAIHILCVAAIGLSPQQISDNEGQAIEVAMGEQAEQPGVAEALEPNPTPAVAPAPAPAPETIAPPPPQEVVKPAKVKAAPKKKAAAKPVSQEAPVEKTEEVAEVKAEEPVAQEPEAEELTPEIANINEMSKDEAMTEATSPEANTPAPEPETPVAQETTQPSQGETASAQATSSQQTEGVGPMGKGGATQEGAVAYTDLRQIKGNKIPTYPLKARKEKRSGQVELVYRVTKEGAVTDVQIAKSSGHGDLDQSAVRAVSKFRFVPGQEGWAYHPVAFALRGDEAPLPSKLRTAGSQGAE